MSALGFVKTQRLPGGINGEDEIFQKELAAVRGKLASKANQRQNAPPTPDRRRGHRPALGRGDEMQTRSEMT